MGGLLLDVNPYLAEQPCGRTSLYCHGIVYHAVANQQLQILHDDLPLPHGLDYSVDLTLDFLASTVAWWLSPLPGSPDGANISAAPMSGRPVQLFLSFWLAHDSWVMESYER